MLKTHEEERMANDGEDGNGFRYGFLEIQKFGSKIVALLQKCCCSVDFLQESAFYHLVGAY